MSIDDRTVRKYPTEFSADDLSAFVSSVLLSDLHSVISFQSSRAVGSLPDGSLGLFDFPDFVPASEELGSP
jgi:hypothetical protein